MNKSGSQIALRPLQNSMKQAASLSRHGLNLIMQFLQRHHLFAQLNGHVLLETVMRKLVLRKYAMNQQITDSFKRISADPGDYDPFYFCFVLQGCVQVALNAGGPDSVVSVLAAGDFHLDGLRSLSSTHELTFISKSEFTLCAVMSKESLESSIRQRLELELLNGLSVNCRAVDMFRHLSVWDNRIFGDVKDFSKKKKMPIVDYLKKQGEKLILSKDQCISSFDVSEKLVFMVAGTVEVFHKQDKKYLATFHANSNPFALVHLFKSADVTIRSMSSSIVLLQFNRDPLMKYFSEEDVAKLELQISRYILDVIDVQNSSLDRQKLFPKRSSYLIEQFEHADKQLKRYVLENKCECVEFNSLETIYKSDSYASCFYIVISGSVALIDENDSIIARCKPGNIFGQETYFNGFKRTYNAIVDKYADKCAVVPIPFSALDDLSILKDRILTIDNKSIKIDAEISPVQENTLKDIRCLRNLKQEIMEQLCKMAVIVTYPANRQINLSQNEPTAFYILKGKVITYGEDNTILRDVSVEQIFGYLSEMSFSNSRNVVDPKSELKAVMFNEDCLQLISSSSPFIYGMFKVSCKLGFNDQTIQLLEREFLIEPESAQELLSGVRLLLYQEGEVLPIQRIISRSSIAYVVKGSFVINPRLRYASDKRQHEYKEFVYFNASLDESVSFLHNTIVMYVNRDVANILDRNFTVNSHRLSESNQIQTNLDATEIPWIKIFEFLDRKQLLESRRVCKEWKNTVEKVINISSINLHGQRFSLPKFYGLMGMAGPSLRRCDFNHAPLNFSHIKLLYQLAANITHLNLQECRDIDTVGIIFVFRNFKHLQKLELYALNVSEPLIRSISCRNLQSLKVKRIQCSDNARIDAFFQEISSELIEFSTERINDTILEYLCRRCKNLRKLSIKNSWQVTDNGIHHISLQLPKLVHLSLVGVVNITDSAIQELAKGVQKWEYLSFALCSNLTDNMVFYFSSSKVESLIHLDLSHCSRLTDSIVSYLSQVCTRLRFLNVSGCPHISDAVLAKYISKAVQVKKNNIKSKPAAMKAINIPLDQRYTVHAKFVVQTIPRKPATNLTAFL